MALATTLAAGLTGAVLLVFAPSAAAEEISKLTVAAVVSADTTMSLTETIDYDFAGTVRHGIYRDIPVYEELVTGDERHYGVDVTSATMDGQPVPYETSTEGGYLRVRIGDADEFVTGRHEYVVAYTVTGALRPMTDSEAAAIGGPDGGVELYWNFVGDGWEVPITGARATLDGPADFLGIGCYAGPYGSEDPCPATATGSRVVFGPTALAPRSSLTGAAAWPAAAFSVAAVQDIRRGPAASFATGALIGGVAGLIAIAAMVGLALAWRRRDAGASLPLSPAVYSPPAGLPPAAMIAAIDGAASSPTALMATLLDLAARGWVTIAADDDTVRLTRRDAGPGDLRDWESALLDTIFADGSTAEIGEYDEYLQHVWTRIGMTLVDRAEADGFRNADGGRPDRRWMWFGLVGASLTVVSIAALVFAGPTLTAGVACALGVGLVIGWIAATIITPRAQTQTSARFQAEVAGLEKVLGTEPAAGRQLFAQTSGLAPAAILATMLPYAVALGLEDAWVSAFPDLEAKDLSGHGLDVTSAALLGAMVHTGVSSSSSSLTTPPPPSSSSGGSGLSGGGFAGGGGGGGGGGSW